MRRTALGIDRLIAPLVLFVSFYLATLVSLLWLRLPYFQWLALVSVTVGTSATVALWEQGRWSLGLASPPIVALRELGSGVLFACALIGAADVLIIATTGVRHEWGSGFPYAQLLTVFVPAAIHEELLFRGYPFQKIWRRWPAAAIIIFSAGFAVLHIWNDHVTPLALFNIFLGGILLSLAYVRYERLWFPIGLHFAWNLLSGPVLGHAVSGFAAEATLVRVLGEGPAILTGGAFGIEGSLFMTVSEAVGIVVLMQSRRRMQNAERRIENEESGRVGIS